MSLKNKKAVEKSTALLPLLTKDATLFYFWRKIA